MEFLLGLATGIIVTIVGAAAFLWLVSADDRRINAERSAPRQRIRASFLKPLGRRQD